MNTHFALVKQTYERTNMAHSPCMLMLSTSYAYVHAE